MNTQLGLPIRKEVAKMFDNLGVLFIDHVAVTTKNLRETARHYLSIPNARIVRGPAWNASQKVHYIFINFGNEMCVEILGLPENSDSPISQHVEAGGGSYHICFCVKDLDQAIDEALKMGSKLVSEPSADDAYDKRRVAFMFHKQHGLFELVDAYGDLFKDQDFEFATSVKCETKEQNIAIPQVDFEHELKIIFEKIFKNLPTDLTEWDKDKITEWDSLQQLRLVMEIERSLILEVESAFANEFTSFEQMLNYIERTAQR